jgi:D-alanine-D-alanine ligase
VGSSLQFVDELRALKPKVVFNLCETLDGVAANEALIPAMLEFLHVHYTGSGVLTLATALRKDRTKELLRSRGVPTPKAIAYDVVPSGRLPFPFPAIVKPNSEDGSLGIHSGSVVRTLPELRKQAKALLRTYGGSVLVEQYVEGREIIVPLLEQVPGSRDYVPLAMSEIDFSAMPAHMPKIVTYRGKWEEDSDDYRGSTTRINPKLSATLKKRIEKAARGAFEALDCRGYGRVDMRVSKKGEPFVIDVNPNCDLSPAGGFFRACKAAGMSYADMVMKLVAQAG